MQSRRSGTARCTAGASHHLRQSRLASSQNKHKKVACLLGLPVALRPENMVVLARTCGRVAWSGRGDRLDLNIRRILAPRTHPPNEVGVWGSTVSCLKRPPVQRQAVATLGLGEVHSRCHPSPSKKPPCVLAEQTQKGVLSSWSPGSSAAREQIDVPGEPRRSRGVPGSIFGLKPRNTGPKSFSQTTFRFGTHSRAA